MRFGGPGTWGSACCDTSCMRCVDTRSRAHRRPHVHREMRYGRFRYRASPCAGVDSTDGNDGTLRRTRARYQPPRWPVSVVRWPWRVHRLPARRTSTGGLKIRQPVQWTCCAADDMSADMRVFRGGCEGCMSEESLNDMEIRSKLQEMSGKTMT